jgi:hypothetical protein
MSHKILRIGRYVLYHYTFTEDDKPGEYYTFTQEQPDDTYQFLYPDGTFQYPKNWIVPYFSTLDEIIAAFKKYLTTAELLKLKFSSDIAQMIDAQ